MQTDTGNYITIMVVGKSGIKGKKNIKTIKRY